MPIAFACTGYVGGILCTILFTFLYIYGIHLMLQCMVEARARNNSDDMTMAETVAYAFDEGPKGCHPCSSIFGNLVNILLIVVHFSIGVMYIVFIAENFKSLANTVFEGLNIRIFIAIVAICIVPLFLIRDVNYLVPLNITGNILVFIVIGSFLCMRTMGIKFAPGMGEHKIVHYDIHLYIGFVMFSLSSVGVMVTIESKMAEPEAYLGWWGTLNRATCFTLGINLIWGLIAYYNLGEDMYMPFLENASLEKYGECAKFCAAALVYLTYPLNGYVPINIICNQYISKGRDLKDPVCVEIVVRIVFLILTTICALALPLMLPVVKLICAIGLPLLNLIFPACTKLCLGYDSDEKVLWILLHILIIFLGIGILLCGVYSAYYDITIYYLEDPIKTPFWVKVNEDIN